MKRAIKILLARLVQLKASLNEFIISRRSVEDTEIKTYKSELKGRGLKACLFASWDPDGRIDIYIINYLAELYSKGFDIYFCTTSSVLDQQDLSSAMKYCRVVTHRTNIGLDFASWGLLWRKNPELAGYKSILLANDSVFGPLRDLEPHFNRINDLEADIVGMTDSWEKYYHIQSYFLFFKEAALTGGFLDDFLNGVQLTLNKEKIIEKYEVGISQAAIRKRLRVCALYPYLEVRDKAISYGREFQYHELIRTQPCNSTIFMWDLLLKDFNFPFLKTELLKINRKGSLNIVRWRHLFREVGIISEVDQSIQSYIARTTPNAKI